MTRPDRQAGLAVPRSRDVRDPWSRYPEASLALFSFLLHFSWELLQVPLFRDMPEAAHASAIRVCLQATLGDVVIALSAFWTVAAASRDRFWLLAPTGLQWGGYLAVGIGATIVLEKLATEVLDRWQYGDLMPVLPVLGVGASPLAQWVLLPPLALWFTRRHVTAGILLARG